MLLSPDKTAAVVTLLNFGPGLPVPPIASLNVTAALPFLPSRVESVEHGELDFKASSASDQQHMVSVQVPLRYADFIKYSSPP